MSKTLYSGRFGRRLTVLVGCALIVAFAAMISGCFGGGDEPAPKTTSTARQGNSGTTTTTIATVVDESAEYSTFRSKDPFIAQVQSGGTSPSNPPTTATSSTVPTRPSVTTPTTITRPTTTTRVAQTTSTTSAGGGGGSTSTSAPTSTTSTTAPHVHTLRVLSVGQVGGAAAVTVQVDSSVYKDKRIGSVISTSWGQVKVLDINVGSKVVTLLHGSETLNLVVGQAVYE